MAEAVELPDGAPRCYWARSPWRADASKPAVELRAGVTRVFDLEPFEVLTLDVVP